MTLTACNSSVKLLQPPTIEIPDSLKTPVPLLPDLNDGYSKRVFVHHILTIDLLGLCVGRYQGLIRYIDTQ